MIEVSDVDWTGIMLWHSMALLGSQGVIRWAGRIRYDTLDTLYSGKACRSTHTLFRRTELTYFLA